MKVQQVHLDGNTVTWIVLDDSYLPVRPIQEFLRYLRNIERSPNTIRSYAYHLKLYWEYLRDTNLDWTSPTTSSLADFIHWLRSPSPGIPSIQEQEAVRTEATVNAILATVGVFYDYQEREGVVEGLSLYRLQMQPGRRYKSFLHHINKSKPVRTRTLKLKEPRRTPKTLSQEQVKQLIDSCQRLRDKFLLCLLYETGMRIGQALGLRHQDIKSWDNTIQIVPREGNINRARAKTRETYTIHVSRELMELYADYLFQEVGDLDCEYVFVNLWDGEIGAPMRYGAVADLFDRLSRKIGVDVHPHLLRHTHATELIQSGWNVAHVQKRLGHASVQTTINTYTHLSDKDMKQAHQQYLDIRNKQEHESSSKSVVD